MITQPALSNQLTGAAVAARPAPLSLRSIVGSLLLVLAVRPSAQHDADHEVWHSIARGL